MNIKIMDCTLRDGGYKNNWEFSPIQIKNIITSLNAGKIDYIECGYLACGNENNKITTKFQSLTSFNKLISEISHSIQSELFLMVDFQHKNELKLTDKNSYNQYLDGIRLAFHKKDFQNISNVVKNILDKGYKICLQPMLTSLYSDSELQQLINSINNLNIAAFYIVDSFGNMNFKELDRLFSIIDKYLIPPVSIGFHPHNNLQLAFANSIHLININNSRKIIIDSSVSGIGRGTGNLNTEIIINYLSKNNFKDYNLIPILQIIDDQLSEIFPDTDFREKTSYFLAASRGCHPAYPAYFVSKGYIKLTTINDLINKIDENFLNLFKSDYAEELLERFLI